MSKFEQNEYTLPAYWASYLINGDHSGMEDSDKEACDKWLGTLEPGEHVVSCSEDSWFSWRNDATSLGGDVMTFTTLRSVASPDERSEEERS